MQAADQVFPNSLKAQITRSRARQIIFQNHINSEYLGAKVVVISLMFMALWS